MTTYGREGGRNGFRLRTSRLGLFQRYLKPPPSTAAVARGEKGVEERREKNGNEATENQPLAFFGYIH